MGSKGTILTIKEAEYQIKIIQGENEINPLDDNVDVEIEFNSGDVFFATFFTLSNIRGAFRKNKATNDCAQGLYFWASDMIIVERLTIETIREAISDLVSTGEVSYALTKKL